MRVLVLHNSNIPDFLMLDKKDNDIFITSKSVTLPETDIPDFDVFISNKLADRNEADIINKKYDIIVLPYNTTDNYLEYSGLRIAAHIRLTKQWQSLSTPILFIGPDSFEEINQFSELAPILSSFNIYTSSSNTEDEIFAKLRWIDQNAQTSDSIEDRPEYKDFLKRMKCLSAPANYATHHSLANEWAIMRWNDMMTNPVELSNKDFSLMLYYKYLRAIYGEGQSLEEWKKNNSNIEDIEVIKGKKLVLIDDEWEKGWAEIINHIANSSGFLFDKCPIQKDWDRFQLIKNVKNYIDNNIDADCFLLDLRLHDDDFEGNKNLTGFDIMDYIRNKNVANPIVIFSASNKVWNLRHATSRRVGSAIGYVLKETPENALKAKESYELYKDFKKAVKASFMVSELKKVVDKQKELKKYFKGVEPLDEFVNLVIQDKGMGNNSFIKACLLNMMTFLEEYIKERYTLTIDKATNIINLVDAKDKSKKKGEVTCHVFARFEDNELKQAYYTREKTRPNYLFSFITITDLGIMLASLFIVYSFSEDDVNNYFVPIKNARNEIAHTSRETTIKMEDLYNLYFNIIVPIIEHDFKK